MFKKLFVLKYLIFLILFGSTILCAKEFKLDNNIKILIRKNCSTIDKFAAEELKKHLLLAGAKKCDIGHVDKKITSPLVLTFYIGQAYPGFDKKLQNTEARYAIRGNKVYLWGENRISSRLTLKQILGIPSARCGTLSAVYAFLADKLAVKWIRPGDSGIYCSKTSTLNLADTEDYKWVMPMNMCGVRVYWWRNRLIQPLTRFTPEKLRCSVDSVDEHSLQDFIWFRRMRLGTKSRIRYGHAFGKWWKKYGQIHPEWFGMNPNGKRGLPIRYSKRNKLCLSNNQVVDQIIKEWQEKGAPERWNICPNDGSLGYCRCEDCMALDCRKKGETFYDHLTDRYVNFWNRIVGKAVKIRPDVKFITYVYSYYRFPPRREKIKYPDNMILGMVPMMFEDNEKMFKEWQELGAKHVFLRPNDLCISSSFFMGLEKRIYDKFKASMRFKLFGTDYDGGCGIRTLDFAYYITARMIVDQEKSFEELENDYCSTYGKAAPVVKEFYAYYRKLGETNLKKVASQLTLKNRQLLDSSQLIPEILRNTHLYYSQDDFKNATEILEKGKQLKLDQNSKKRLNELIILNEHALKTYDFLVEAQKKQLGRKNNIESAAKALVKFREKESKTIDWCWQYLFARTEKTYWLLSNWYLKYINLKINEDKDILLWSSFDLPAMDGWRKRAQFSKITNKTASFDQFSVELTASRKEGLGISYHGFKVEPGKIYKLSYDYLLGKENSPTYLRLRCVGRGNQKKSRVLFNLYSRKKGKYWQSEEKTFKVPADINNITFYFNVGPGRKGQVVNIDKISCRIIKDKK